MVSLLLTETEKLGKTLHDVENMAHAVGLPIMVHHKGEPLDEILDFTESKLIAFTPSGKLSLDEMIERYGGDVLIAVGGFTDDKELPLELLNRAETSVSLGSEFLTIPQVVEQIIQGYTEHAKNRKKE